MLEEAKNGLDGLNKIKNFKPDLIMLDLLMPEMDGFAFLEKFHKLYPDNKIPVFVLTAKNLTKKDQDELKKYKLKAIPKNSTDLSAIEVKLKKLLKNFKVKK